MRAAKYALCDPFKLLERRHGLAEIVVRGGGVLVEGIRVIFPRPERDFVTLAENASHHGHRFKHQCLGFFEAL